MISAKNLMQHIAEIMQRYPGLLAVLAFVSGVASYVLVERKESLAQVIALFLLFSWLWLLLDNWLSERLEQRFDITISKSLMRYVLQMAHQESLFFALPFFLAVTNWQHAHAIFTLLILLCALVSLIDPWYYKKLAPRRTLFVIFHAFALFVVLLVILPVLLQLTTSQSIAAALSIAITLSLPSLGGIMPNARWWRLPCLVLLLAALSAGVWQLRSFIPPAALRLTGITLSHDIDYQQRKPGPSITELDETSLHQQGLFSFTAVKAPRGLNEKIYHVWLHNGKEVDRIQLDIAGGREQGYRAWSHKQNFGANARGKWQVKIITESEQLIGLVKFTVTAAESVDTASPAQEDR
jgi:glycopeptide antibiotics resistance protein